MRNRLLLSAVFGAGLGIGIYALVRFAVDKLWKYLLPQLGGRDMSTAEAELIRAGVALILVLAIGYLLYRWGKRAEDDESRRHNELLDAIRNTRPIMLNRLVLRHQRSQRRHYSYKQRQSQKTRRW
ncbi:hypothetical protein ACFLUK_03320 [Chloroflexota bacterium]